MCSITVCAIIVHSLNYDRNYLGFSILEIYWDQPLDLRTKCCALYGAPNPAYCSAQAVMDMDKAEVNKIQNHFGCSEFAQTIPLYMFVYFSIHS